MADTLRIDTRSALAGFAALGQAGRIGAARTLKRTATAAKTFMVRRVAKDMGLTQTPVNKAVTMRVRESDGVIQIIATGSQIPLINFKARGPYPSRGKGRGVSYDVGQGRKTIPNAFIAVVGSGGHRGVFVRKRQSRLPIQERFGPSVAPVFANHLTEGHDYAQQALVKNATHELAFAIRSAGR